jgi:hypothetical protein
MPFVKLEWDEGKPWELYFGMRFRHEWVTLSRGVFPDGLLSAMYATPIGREFIRLVKDWDPEK